MTYRDDDQFRSPNTPHAMIGGPAHPSDALVVQSNGATASNGYAIGPVLPVQDVLRGSMDPATFLHALRRRWMLAVCMGMVAAAAAAVGLWFAFPESHTAVALFQVSSEPPSLVFNVDQGQTRKFETIQKTQLALLKQHFVLAAAVRSPAVASLSVLAGQGDPVQWLQDNLAVDFPQQSEILSITLTGSPPEDLRQLVDSVANAYRSEVIYAERQRRLVTRDALASSLRKVNGDLTRKMEEYYDVGRELRSSQAYEQDYLTNLLSSEVNSLQRQKSELENQIIHLRMEFMIIKGRLEDPAVIEARVDEYLANDPQVRVLQEQLMAIHYRLASLAPTLRRGRSRETTDMERRMAELNSQISQYRAQVRSQLINQEKSAPNQELQMLTKEAGTRLQFAQQRLAGIETTLEEKMGELETRLERSVDLLQREQELEQLKSIAKDMSIKLESLDVERDAPDRIVQLQPAIPRPRIRTAMRYTIVGLGAAGAFSLVCFGIGFLEFRHRRLNDPDQVDEGLGIRVVGTLPSLTGRRAVDPHHPVVAQLTDSIDSVRTVLMHDSSNKQRQVVLVTSAATSEGRTTVASQLAASLARAGRRTLLVDGDLRRPVLHSLFDVPLEDGLCEVLRAEIDVADVIRPTHAEGLWLLTAGYCDVDAIHALATEQMQPVFDKLRADFDFIIIDGAPVIGMSDALIFGQYSDGAVISVRRDHSQMPKIHQTAELLRDVGIRIIGAVVNGVPTKADDRVTQLRLIAPKAEREQLQPTA